MNDLSNTMSDNAVKSEQTAATAEQVRLNIEEACHNMSAKYATVSATELAIAQVIGQLDNLRSELMSSANVPARPNAHDSFHIHTPDEPTTCHVETREGQAYGSGPGGQPMWNSRLPSAALPAQPMVSQSPLRSPEQPYVAPPTAADRRNAATFSDGVQDHAGCIASSPGATQAAPSGPPASWAQPPGAATPP